MKYRFIAVAALMSLALTGCLDEHTPNIEDVKRTGCVDPSDPDAGKYYLADSLHECVKEETSFHFSGDLYCCKRPPQCSDYGFYQQVGDDSAATCSAKETDLASSEGKEARIVMENGKVCCYHPTCRNKYGSNYVESEDNGTAACSAESKSDAEAVNQPASFQLATGEMCCYTSDLKPNDGPNCDSGWITTSETEQKSCHLTFTEQDLLDYTQMAIEEAKGLSSNPNPDSGSDGDSEADKETDNGEDTSDWYYCKRAKDGKGLCRYVPEENQGSRVTYQPGQNCTPDELNPPADSLRIHVMDIGQGDSIWIQTPDGKNVLVDGGDGAAFNTQSSPIIKDYLLTHGFPADGEFDAVFLTHPHSDHFGGLIGLFATTNKFKIKNYIDPMELNTKESVPSNYSNKWMGRVKALVKPENIYMPAEDKFKVGEGFPTDFFGPSVTTEYLYSNKSLTAFGAKNENSASIIFRLTYAGVSMLFTGDAEAAQESKAVATGKVEANFLKVCHHGSPTSSSPGFLSAMWSNIAREKRAAFISSGRRTFSGTYIPDVDIIKRLLEYVNIDNIFSTSAGDDWKHESQTYRDDNILIVVKSDGTNYACYSGTN